MSGESKTSDIQSKESAQIEVATSTTPPDTHPAAPLEVRAITKDAASDDSAPIQGVDSGKTETTNQKNVAATPQGPDASASVAPSSDAAAPQDAMAKRTELASLKPRWRPFNRWLKDCCYSTGILIRKGWNFLLNLLTAVAGNPFFGMITAIVTVLTGCLASFFTNDIKEDLYFSHWMHREFSNESFAFWVGVALTGFCLGAGQWAQSRKTNQSAKEMQRAVERLQTLPAEGYLPSYVEYYRFAAQQALAASMIQTSPGVDAIATYNSAIRYVLHSIIQIAKVYDKAHPGTKYSVNLMLWRPGGQNLESPNPVQIIPFTIDHPGSEGLLELIPALSTTSDSSQSNCVPDSEMLPLVLPVQKDRTPTRDDDWRERSPVLPGATWCFCKKTFLRYADAAEISTWLKTKVSIDNHSSRRITDYFSIGDGKYIRSFACAPIYSLYATQKKGVIADDPIAILNLHSEREKILGENGGTLFAPLLEPYLVLLSILLGDRHDEFARRRAKNSSNNGNVDSPLS